MSYKIGCRIEDKKLWDEFRKWVKKKHGRTRDVMGEELTLAIINHMANETTTPKQSKTDEKPSKLNQEVDKTLAVLEKEYPNGEIERLPEIRTVVCQATGLKHKEAINPIIQEIERKNIIILNQDGTYTIFPNKYDPEKGNKRVRGEIDMPKLFKEKITKDNRAFFLHYDKLGRVQDTILIGFKPYEILKITETTLEEVQKTHATKMGFEDEKTFANNWRMQYKGREPALTDRVYLYAIMPKPEIKEETEKITEPITDTTNTQKIIKETKLIQDPKTALQNVFKPIKDREVE